MSAASALLTPPVNCLVIEDSAAGVVAATAARMSVVAVPALEDLGEPAFALAQLVLTSLDELTPTWLDQQFGR